MDLSVLYGLRRTIGTFVLLCASFSVMAERFTFEDVEFEAGEQYRAVQNETFIQGDFILTVYEGVLLDDNYSFDQYGESFHPNTGSATDPISNISLITQYFKVEHAQGESFAICSFESAELRNAVDENVEVYISEAGDIETLNQTRLSFDRALGYQANNVVVNFGENKQGIVRVENLARSPALGHFDNIRLESQGGCQ